MQTRLPHPIPYQGSKRRLADRILSAAGGRPVATLYEPFAGSAALTIAASARGVARRYVIGDSLAPLVSIWEQVLGDPVGLARRYEGFWEGQLSEGSREHFDRIRAEFNAEPEAARLLYLLTRCVKNAPRFSRFGFSQSADHRRKGIASSCCRSRRGSENRSDGTGHAGSSRGRFSCASPRQSSSSPQAYA